MLRKEWPFLLPAWLLASAAVYFLVAFLAPAQPNFYQSLILPAILIGLLGWAFANILGGLIAAFRLNWKAELLPLLALLVLARFSFKVVSLALSTPKQLPAGLFTFPTSTFPFFIAAALTGLALVWVLQTRAPAGSAYIAGNWRGFALALLLFVIYFVLANVFNRLDFNNNNVFFAADSHQWRVRLADPFGPHMEMRAIHPLGFFPRWLIYGLSFVLAATPFQALLVFLALLGASSVYLAWLFIKKAASNEIHALLFAGLFGVSTANLVFNSLVETYIFSAFLLILFLVLLQKQSKSYWLVATGVATFGITISNLVQVLIASFLADLKIRRAMTFAIVVLTISAGLSLANKAVFPNSGYFFNPADYAVEEQHYQTTDDNGGWPWRAKLVATDMFAFSIAAPQPFLQTYHKDGRDEFPKFNMMQGDRLARYVGLGKPAAALWLGIVVTALALFVRAWRAEGFSAHVRLCAALLLCLLFNFAFHLVYGFEPFLYAADWTYALIFSAALALRPLAANRWLQGAALVLLALLTLNNLSFLYFLMNGWAPLLPG